MTEELNGADEYGTLMAVVEGIVDPPLQKVKQQVSDELATLRFDLENQLQGVEEAHGRLQRALEKEHAALESVLRTSTQSSQETILEGVGDSRDLIATQLRAAFQQLAVQADSRAKSCQVEMGVRAEKVERLISQESSTSQAQRLSLREQLTVALEKLTILETKQREDRVLMEKTSVRLTWMVAANLVGIGIVLALLLWHLMNV